MFKWKHIAPLHSERLFDPEGSMAGSAVSELFGSVLRSRGNAVLAFAAALSRRMGQEKIPPETDLSEYLASLLEESGSWPDEGRSLLEDLCRPAGERVFFGAGPECGDPSATWTRRGLLLGLLIRRMLERSVLAPKNPLRLEAPEWLPLMSAYLPAMAGSYSKQSLLPRLGYNLTFIYAPLAEDFFWSMARPPARDLLRLPVYLLPDLRAIRGYDTPAPVQVGFAAVEALNQVVRPVGTRGNVMARRLMEDPEYLLMPGGLVAMPDGSTRATTVAQVLTLRYECIARLSSRHPGQDLVHRCFATGAAAATADPPAPVPLAAHQIAGNFGATTAELLGAKDPSAGGTVLLWALLNGAPLNPKSPHYLMDKSPLGGKGTRFDLYEIPVPEAVDMKSRPGAMRWPSPVKSRGEGGLSYIEAAAAGIHNLAVRRQLTGPEALDAARDFVRAHEGALFDAARLCGEAIPGRSGVTCADALRNACRLSPLLGMALTESLLEKPDLWNLPVRVQAGKKTAEAALLSAVLGATRPYAVMFKGWDYKERTRQFILAIIPALERNGGWGRWRRAVHAGPGSAVRMADFWNETDRRMSCGAAMESAGLQEAFPGEEDLFL